MTQISCPPTAKLYARATGFIDAPFGFDGQFERLAGGMQFFSQWHIIAVDGGVRCGEWLTPIEDIDAALAPLTDSQKSALLEMMAAATKPRMALTLGERIIRLDQPQIMAILNMTPDSFSGGSDALDDPAAAAALAVDMASQGAALVDIGGESTRPGAKTVWEDDEKKRVLPVLAALKNSGLAISLDTRKAAVMEEGLAAGAHIINDVSALLYDDRSVEVIAQSSCPVVLMHYPGKPHDPHANDSYSDVLIEVYDWLEDRIEAVCAAGVARERILIDPGIGFGKGVADNLALMNGLSILHGLGCPIVLGASRKRLIGALSAEAPAEQRLAGSVTLALKGVEQGAQILRVHDVPETVQALRVWRGLRDRALTPPKI